MNNAKIFGGIKKFSLPSLYNLYGMNIGLLIKQHAKNYVFEDIDGGKIIISGKALVEDGFKLELPKKGVAKIYLYRILQD